MRRQWRTGGGGVYSITLITNIFLFFSLTQIQLLANPLLCVVLSSTGIISVDPFRICGFHKLLSKGFQLYSIWKISVFITGFIVSVLWLTTLVLWLNYHDSGNIKFLYIIWVGCQVSAVLMSVIYSDKSCTETRNTSQHQCACFGI